MTLATKELEVHWANIAPLLSIRNEREYNAAVKRFNELLDEIGTTRNIRFTGCWIHSERLLKSMKKSIVRSLMLRGRSVVSEILNGKRELNVRQVRILAEKFKVSSAVFL